MLCREQPPIPPYLQIQSWIYTRTASYALVQKLFVSACRIRSRAQPHRDRQRPELVPVEGVGEVDVEGGLAVDGDVRRGSHQVGIVVICDDALVVGVPNGHRTNAGGRRVHGERERVCRAAADAGDHATVRPAAGLAVAGDHLGRASQHAIGRLICPDGTSGRGDGQGVKSHDSSQTRHHDLVDARAQVHPARRG